MRQPFLLIVTACCLFYAAAGLPAQKHIDIQNMSIYGDKELPVVEFKIPWRHSDIRKVSARPIAEQFDELLKGVVKELLLTELRESNRPAAERIPANQRDIVPDSSQAAR